MKNTRNCKACGQTFEVDPRNAQRHSHCPKAACQKARRTLAQEHRRNNQATSSNLAAFSRLQQEVKPPEADILAEHPMFIGLISMLTGSSDLQEIKGVARRLFDRGRDILGIQPDEITKIVAQQQLANRFEMPSLKQEFQTARLPPVPRRR